MRLVAISHVAVFFGSCVRYIEAFGPRDHALWKAEKLTKKSEGPFGALHKGINLDVVFPRANCSLGPFQDGEQPACNWFKSQYDAAQMQSIAEAGFESVRVFLGPPDETQNQIDDALANHLSIVIVMWGQNAWSTNPSLGQTQIAEKWGQLASRWKNYSSKLVFEVLNEPQGIGFSRDHAGNVQAMGLYNAALQAIRDEDPARPVLISSGGYNDPEFLDPYVTEEYLTYKFEGGKGFYDDPNVGAAIHIYEPRGEGGLNFAFTTEPLGQNESRWKDPITDHFTHAVNWRKKIGHDIPIITTEWGCWLFQSRIESGDAEKWLDFHMSLFNTSSIGNMWYVGIMNNQEAFSIFDSETGWNQAALGKLTGVQPSKWPSISQTINGEFLQTMEPWKLSTDKITGQIITSGAYSGSSMLKLTVPLLEGSGGQLYMQTHDGGMREHPAPGRTLLHLIQGNTYKIRFMSGTDAGQHGCIKVKLRDASDQRLIEEFNWIDVSATPITNSISYMHSSATEMNVTLEFDVGAIQQVLYLDKVEFIRDMSAKELPEIV